MAAVEPSSMEVEPSNQLIIPEERRNKTYGNSREWLQEISSRQQSFVTPEIRQRFQEKARRQKVRGRKKKRAKVYQKCAVMNKRAWAQGNAKMLRSAPSGFAESTNSSREQMRSIQTEVYRAPQRISYEDDEAYEAEESRLDMVVSNLETAQLQDEVQVSDEGMDSILHQLRREPTNDAEITTKFGLYEDFLKTVEDSRKATYTFWGDCKEDFEAVEGAQHAIIAIEKSIKDIDKEDNMGIDFNGRNWFVYDMTRKADSNNEKLKNCLHSIEIKLELLDKNDDCPFCLESGRDSVTLGCCHKACKECWKHWQELKGQNAFCPLCRQEDFLGDMCGNN